MKLKRRFIVAFAIIAVFTTTMGLFTLNRMQKSFLELESIYSPSLTSVLEIQIAIKEQTNQNVIQKDDEDVDEQSGESIIVQKGESTKETG